MEKKKVVFTITIFILGLVAVLFFINAQNTEADVNNEKISSNTNDKMHVAELSGINSITGFVAHPVYPSFSSPEIGFILSGTSLSVNDTAVYKTGYYSINGTQWQSFNLSGTAYGASTIWLTGSATKTLPVFGPGEHYVIVYSCKYNYAKAAWNCSDNRWQLIIINNGNTDSTPPAIAFNSPTPNNGAAVTSASSRIVATITDASSSIYSFIDFDKSLLLWLRLENNAVDSSTNNWYTEDGGVTYSTGIFGKSANVFSETKNIVVNSDLDYASTDMTISFWMYVNDYTNPERQNPMGKAYGGDGTFTLETSGLINFYFGSSGEDTDPYISIETQNTVTAGKWEHWAITRNRATRTVQWYKNGVAETPQTYDAEYDPVHSANDLVIGNNYANPFNGKIDEVMIFNKALSSSEILALYNSKANKFDATLTNLANGVHSYTVYAVDSTGNKGSSARTFTVSGVVSCNSGDGQCPSGCTYSGGDTDCAQCTAASDCPAGNSCQTKTCSGTPKRCGFAAKTACTAGDSCCPNGCTYSGGDTDCTAPGSSSKIIIDHRTTDSTKIPESYITAAKNNLHWVYTSTSHGRQIYWGLNALSDFNPSLYGVADHSASGKLYIDYSYYGGIGGTGGCYDIGNCGEDIYSPTVDFLDSNSDFNVVMWSWCSINGHEIYPYLDSMKSLIEKYPDVHFVFMTGHTEGDGVGGGVDTRNNIIRDFINNDAFCDSHECILFDFADIEEHNPAGEDYMDNYVTENLNYDDGNWGDEYVSSHSDRHTNLIPYIEPYGCDHSSTSYGAYMNCALKGEAAWWMLARIEGWGGP
jgi:hypothetical protein